LVVAGNPDPAHRNPPAADSRAAPCGTPQLRRPCAQDGPAVTALIAACPPLDPNSAYCNLLQCSHFAGTAIVAERDGEMVGWISGYRLPADPTRLFIWQVAVAGTARGTGLAGRMLDGLLDRPETEGVTHLVTTITRSNGASWAMFRSWARKRPAPLAESELFEKDRHFSGRHPTEWQVEIGPLERSRAQRTRQTA